MLRMTRCEVPAFRLTPRAPARKSRGVSHLPGARRMKLATLKDGTRDGRLIVVKRDQSAFVPATAVAPTLQAALDQWDALEPRLRALAEELESGLVRGEP